jgi:hypothetical protein
VLQFSLWQLPSMPHPINFSQVILSLACIYSDLLMEMNKWYIDTWKVSKLQSKIRVCVVWWKEAYRVRFDILLHKVFVVWYSVWRYIVVWYDSTNVSEQHTAATAWTTLLDIKWTFSVSFASIMTRLQAYSLQCLKIHEIMNSCVVIRWLRCK